MNNLLLAVTSLLSTTMFSQPAYHRIWGVKENRKVDILPSFMVIADDVLYYKEDNNKINSISLPETETETFIEIGSYESTKIMDIHHANDGSWYIGGRTEDTESFTTLGAYRTEFDFNQNPTPVPSNGFLAHFSSSGELIWCTYIDFFYDGYNITTDTEGNVYYISYKNNDEVIEDAPFQSTANPEDFVSSNKTPTITKLNSTGEYLWSTFFGTHRTFANIVSSENGLIIYGTLMSNELFTGIPLNNYTYFSTEGAYQELPDTDNSENFLTQYFINKFNFDGTRDWGTYYHVGEQGYSLNRVETYGNDIYVISTSNNNTIENIATEGAFIDALEETSDGMGTRLLSRMNPNGTDLLWRTYLFNDSFVYSYSDISINPDGNIWLSGQTDSFGGIATLDAYQPEKDPTPSYMLSHSDAYHLLLSNDGSTVLYSSYYGFDGRDWSRRIFPTENGYYSVEQTSGNSNPENFITQGNLLEPDEEGSSTYGGLVYTYFSTEPVSSGTFDKKKISIYPNPAENVLHLTGEIEGFTKIDIYNMQGQRVFQQSINAREIISVDINSLASSVYLLTISNTANKQTYRVVKK